MLKVSFPFPSVANSIQLSSEYYHEEPKNEKLKSLYKGELITKLQVSEILIIILHFLNF